MNHYLRCLLLLACFASSAAIAADAPPPPAVKLEPIPEIPAAPPGVVTSPDEETEVTARQDGELRIEEFRRKGKLYQVKVTPRIGAPYYLTDPDNNGMLMRGSGGADSGQRTPSWIIKSW